jgi:signal transduction histidine kinase/ActR/RegA family two-component response regulator
VSDSFVTARHLRRILADQLRPCFVVLDQGFCVEQISGDAAGYGYGELSPGMDCREQMPFLIGLAPGEAIHLPMVETASGAAADVLLAPAGSAQGLLLTDASRERAARRLAQQEANETRLHLEEQRQLLESLRAARDDLESRAQRAAEGSLMKSRFIAGLSHEFRTPLAAILSHVALLADVKRDGELSPTESARLIESNANHLLSLVETVLDQASLELGQLSLHPVPMRLSAFCREMEIMFEHLAAAQGLEFRFHRRGDLQEWIEIDATRLRQVVINLIGNAIKYTERGFVAFILSWERGRLEVAVSDTGPGVSEAARERIFLPFQRADHAGNKRGAGLGLAISAQLVELMGGKLTLGNRPGGGSVFGFTIPAPKIDVGAPVAASMGGPERRILLVDDSDDIRGLYSRLLAKAGFTVDTAADELEAWGRFEAQRPDIAIVDVYLKEWEGTGLVRRLRGRGFTGGIVSWSASSLREDRQRAFDAGADAFVLKPVEISVLCATLTDIARRRAAAA